MRMVRIFGAVLVLAFGLSGCGDDEAASTTSSATSMVTTAATTTMAPTTTVDAASERVAVAAALVGEYSGQWNNTTFGSSGPMSVVISLTGTVVALVVDLGGNVFGVGDPGPFTIEFDLAGADPYAGENELLGAFTFGADADGPSQSGRRLVLSAPAVPGVGGLPLTVTTLLDADVAAALVGEYVIEGLAVGTFTLERV